MFGVIHPSDLSVGQSVSVVSADTIAFSSLAQHPVGEFAGYVLQGIAEGFWNGYNRASWPCDSAHRNMQSAKVNPEVVKNYLEEEMAAGKVVGQLEMGSVQGVQISPFGVIPKANLGNGG